MTWEYEFGESYAIPSEIIRLYEAGLLEDRSWHNDVCPSFAVPGYPEDDDYITRIWVDHPDPEEREFGEYAPRFGVAKGPDQFYSGDDINAALVALWTHSGAPTKRAEGGDV